MSDIPNSARDRLVDSHVLPLIGLPVQFDDDDATIVLVFTKSIEAGGVVDVDRELPNACAMAQEVFLQTPEEEFTGLGIGSSTENGTTKTMDLFEDGMTVGEYQKTIRNLMVQFLRTLGFEVNTFESIDGDEIFVKVHVSEDHRSLYEMAERFHYTLPFKKDAYARAAAFGSYPGGEPMRNAWGDYVPAYSRAYKKTWHLLDEFQPIDLARIVEIRLNISFNLKVLVDQQVLSRYFVAANARHMLQLNEKWASLRRILSPPAAGHDDEIRVYFGEQVAFFFAFFARFVRALVPVGILGFFSYFRRFAFSILVQRYYQLAFAFVMLVWSFAFDKGIRQVMARLNQKWGTIEYDNNAFIVVECHGYRWDVKGTWNLKIRHLMANLVTGVFLAVFAYIVGTMSVAKQSGLHPFLDAHFAVLTSILIKVFGFGWGFVAPKLATWQNPRTQSEWDEKLTWSLAPVKIFLALFPYVQLAFIDKWTMMECRDSLEAAVHALYHTSIPNQEAFPGVRFDIIQNHFSSEYEEQYCVYGCYPIRCEESGACVTNCTESLESGLMVFFLTHVACTILFLVIPIFLVRFFVRQEINKTATMQNSDGSEDDDSEPRTYSFLQVQAKAHEHAPYEYKSWGGSHVEDFVELLIAFALVLCFGLALPVMVFFALIAGIVEYRLFAYRMTNVTCRPRPVHAIGIGPWAAIVTGITLVGAVFNVAYAVVVMYPLREAPPLSAFETFVILEHLVIFIKIMVNGLVHDTPGDVERVKDFNAFFLRSATKYDEMEIHPDEQSLHITEEDLSLD
eukprot:TRINITY_DN21526_c1_g4_i1.p1 TRINITY_DN21526_c1_g4~~TRINITY_DN21526_c1_g4_i1.p1  ORF type:complete len:792 (+),score=119.69 TRINITY_DN21526_c1_g4_i1:61-2436(+)